MPDTMSAREGIQALYARYPFAIDRDDGPAVADCFTPDGAFLISGMQPLVGRDEIARHVRRTADGRPRHLTFNVWIREVEGGAAAVEAYFLLVDAAAGQTVAYGTYGDSCVHCDDGRWRFKERRVQFEWTSAEYAATRPAKAVPIERP